VATTKVGKHAGGPASRSDHKDEDKYLAANVYGNETSRKKKVLKHARKSNMPKHAERRNMPEDKHAENMSVINMQKHVGKNNMPERP